MNHDKRYIWYDLIRGVSALAVLLSHLRAALLVDYAQITHPNLATKAFYLFSGLGHEAVMVFFVLSGFFVGGNILKRRDNFSMGDYAVSRLSRLYSVLLPALILTLALDSLTRIYAPVALSGAYTPIWNSGPTPLRPWSIDLTTFVGNLLFLQTIKTQVFGTNSPLWSLAYEFWYYVLFPTSMIAFGIIRKSLIFRVVCAVVAAGSCFFLTGKILEAGLIWLLGVGLSLVPVFRFKYQWLVSWAASGLFVLSLVMSKMDRFPHEYSDYIVGLSFVFAAIFLRGNSGWFVKIVSTPARWLSECSFSLYVIHFPVLFMAASILYKGRQMQPDLMGLTIMGGWFSALIVLAVLFWFIFERNTNKLKSLMVRIPGLSKK